MLSTLQLSIPQVAQLKELGLNVIDLASAYRNAGDQVSAQNALQIAAALGRRFGNGSAGEGALNYEIGWRIERMALSAMAPSSPYGSNGLIAQDRLNQLAQQNSTLRELARQAWPMLDTMPDQDWMIYIDRWTHFGEPAAMQWLANKYGQK